MDDNINQQSGEVQFKTSGLSTTFTISFEDENENANAVKQKRIIKTASMFTKKHYRTLSLPVANNCSFVKHETDKNVCDYVSKESTVNGDGRGKICVTRTNVEELNGIAKSKEIKPGSETQENFNHDTSTHTSDKRSMDNGFSDTESEGGTYTIDKNNEQVKQARKSIDQVFGISSETENNQNISPENKFEKRSRMIDEWIERGASALKITPDEKSKPSTAANKLVNIKNTMRVSKIPFPIEKSRELGSTTSLNSLNTKSINVTVNGNIRSVLSEPKKKASNFNPSNDEETDTKHFLQETENIVTAIQKRIHNGIKPSRVEDMKTHCNSPTEKETTPSKYSTTRFNRAFSLRRDRLKKPVPVVTNTNVPVRSKTFIGTASVKTVTTEHTSSPKSLSNIKRNNSFCKDCKSDYSSPKIKPTLRSKPNSNSTMRKSSAKSTQEIEFHNWKRRKNYDPLKAVAEEKKRKALAGAVSNSISSAHLKKECSSSEDNDDLAAKFITRSASFHGIRNKNGYGIESPSEAPVDRSASNRSISSYFMPSNDNGADYENDSEDRWVIPKPPSTSLQNTPPESISSRLSLLSNAASNSSVLLTSSMNIRVDSSTVSKVTQMSYKIKDIIIALTDSTSESDENAIQNLPTESKNRGLLSSQNSYNRGSSEGIDNLCDDDNSDDDISYAENNDLSADFQLNIALNNLNEIYQAVQGLQLKCAK